MGSPLFRVSIALAQCTQNLVSLIAFRRAVSVTMQRSIASLKMASSLVGDGSLYHFFEELEGELAGLPNEIREASCDLLPAVSRFRNKKAMKWSDHPTHLPESAEM